MSAIDPVQSNLPEASAWEPAQPASGPAGAGPQDLGAKQLAEVRQPLALAESSGAPAAPAAATPSVGTRVSINIDRQLHEAILEVMDPGTGKVLRQIPPEEALRLRRLYLESQKQTGSKGTGGVA
ncbi:MAG TPA: flagellar protein FlaG [Candidatus Saccharimonadales bacterium]|nr:flagellar protein FlaG [Candidatus Saccharimonadales bacterium]